MNEEAFERKTKRAFLFFLSMYAHYHISPVIVQLTVFVYDMILMGYIPSIYLLFA